MLALIDGRRVEYHCASTDFSLTVEILLCSAWHWEYLGKGVILP